MGTRNKLLDEKRKERDHPHAYGDKPFVAVAPTHRPGSSPRVWGQVSLSLSAINPFGIIPTRMGTRRGTTSTTTGVKDHPHAYGDKH